MKYNVSKFNIKGSVDSENILFTMDCSERIQTTITFSLNMVFAVEGSESIDSSMRATHGIHFSQSLSEDLSVSALLDAHVIIKADCKEDVKTIVGVVKDTKFELELSEEIGNSFYASNNISFNVFASEKLESNFYGSKDIVIKDLFLSESVQTVLRTSLLNLESLTLSITLLPGQSVEIDSEAYSAYIGDTNVLDLYNGDWITVDRNTIGLEIGVGSGGRLQGILVYKERYL